MKPDTTAADTRTPRPEPTGLRRRARYLPEFKDACLPDDAGRAMRSLQAAVERGLAAADKNARA